MLESWSLSSRPAAPLGYGRRAARLLPNRARRAAKVDNVMPAQRSRYIVEVARKRTAYAEQEGRVAVSANIVARDANDKQDERMCRRVRAIYMSDRGDGRSMRTLQSLRAQTRLNSDGPRSHQVSVSRHTPMATPNPQHEMDPEAPRWLRRYRTCLATCELVATEARNPPSRDVEVQLGETRGKETAIRGGPGKETRTAGRRRRLPTLEKRPED